MAAYRRSPDAAPGGSDGRSVCRFLGRRVAAFELRAFFAGVREASRHEIAGAVHGWFSAVLWGIGVAGSGPWECRAAATDGDDAVAPALIAHPGVARVGLAVAAPGQC